MLSDFAMAGRAARASIPAGDAPLRSIREKARLGAKRGRTMALIVPSVLCLVALGAGVRFAGLIYSGVHIVLGPNANEAGAVIQSFAVVREPLAADVRSVTSRATFPVVFPVDLPPMARVSGIAFAPVQHPAFVDVNYRIGSSPSVGFTLVDSNSIATLHAALAAGVPPRMQPVFRWTVGKETVLVLQGAHLSRQSIDRIRAGMMHEPAASSLAVLESMLPTVTVVGGLSPLTGLAERYAPAGSQSVLVTRRETPIIRFLAKNHKSLVDDRMVYLTHIPSVRGEPDYAKAMLHWKRRVAISPNGVSAIAAVLRAAYHAGDCGCSVLFTQHNRVTYWIWAISDVPPHATQKYIVDATTLRVTTPKR